MISRRNNWDIKDISFCVNQKSLFFGKLELWVERSSAFYNTKWWIMNEFIQKARNVKKMLGIKVTWWFYHVTNQHSVLAQEIVGGGCQWRFPAHRRYSHGSPSVQECWITLLLHEWITSSLHIQICTDYSHKRYVIMRKLQVQSWHFLLLPFRVRVRSEVMLKCDPRSLPSEIKGEKLISGQDD